MTNKIPLMIFCWCALSIIWTVQLSTSIGMMLFISVGVLFCYAAIHWPKTFAWILATAFLLNVSLGLLWAWLGISWIPQDVAPAGFAGNKNLLGSFLVGTLPIAGSLYKLLWIPGIVMLLFVGSKASFLSVVSIGLYWFWWRTKSIRNRILFIAGYVIIAGGILTTGITGMLGSQTSYKDRMIYTVNATRIAMIWPRTIYGFGIGTGGQVYRYYNEPILKSHTAQTENKWPHRLHNDWIQTLVETGLIGLGLYLLILFAALKKGRNSPAACALFGLSLNAAMDFPLQLPLGMWTWWILIGLCLTKENK